MPATTCKGAGAFIFLVVDNNDFNADTPDGKHTPMPQLLNDRNLSEIVPCSAPHKQGFDGVITVASFKPKTIFDFKQPYVAQDTFTYAHAHH
jgi:hypothetical protein